MEKWVRARYQPNLPLKEGHRVTASSEHIALSRQAAQEGAVLLKNDGGLLPLALETRVALFGKGSFGDLGKTAPSAWAWVPGRGR